MVNNVDTIAGPSGHISLMNEIQNENKKKKRVRRKPRGKDGKKQTNPPEELLSLQDDILEEIEFNFVIQCVPQANCYMIRQRGEPRTPIHLNSFLDKSSSKPSPCVFYTTQLVSDDIRKARIKEFYAAKTLPEGLLVQVDDLSLDTQEPIPSTRKVPRGTTDARTIRRKKKKEQKKFEKKVNSKFVDFLSDEKLQEGLQDGSLLCGAIRINLKNPKEAYISNRSENAKRDYMINSIIDRNRALDEDEVVYRVKEGEEHNGRTVEVVAITKKIHNRTAIGTLSPVKKNHDYALFKPRDRKMPLMKIQSISWPTGFKTCPERYSKVLFRALLVDWLDVESAEGLLTENLGLSDDLRVESLAILREHNLDPTPYDMSEVRKDFPPSDVVSSAKERLYREDLTKQCVFTIDPATARDLDDAVSCRRLPEGNYEVGVHISDAAFFVPEGTKLDDTARAKATTIYMVESVYHMLPPELCLRCSLLPGEDKFAFSVIWEMSPEGEILKQRFTRSIVNSCVQLSYEHAQSMIDGNLPALTVHNDFTVSDVELVVNDLQGIAVKLREKRTENGALRLDQVKVGFTLDPATGKPVAFHTYESRPAHRLIEEFMLLANMSVAEWILNAYPELAFLRLHEPPKATMMDMLQKKLEMVGIFINISSSGAIQASLNKYISDDFLGKARMTVLNSLLAKPMTRARYFCAGALLPPDTPFSHFALSVPLYTHFTSPIRRYADIVVHRLLAASLGYTEPPNCLPRTLAETAEICNRQKYNAKRAGEASCDLYLAHFVMEEEKLNRPFIQEAVIVEAREKYFDAVVLATGSVVRIYSRNFGPGVAWKAKQISTETESAAQNDDDVIRMWRLEVTFPKSRTEMEVTCALEVFSIVRLQLSKKTDCNILEGKLLRPTNAGN